MSGHKGTIDKFARLYYESDIQQKTFWFGHQVLKPPSDLWNVQEIIWETKPTLVVETGTFHGGSALYYAHLFDVLQVVTGRPDGKVLTIDLVPDDPEPVRPRHRRIDHVEGASSIDPAVIALVRKEAVGKRTMVILDSDHSCDHVLQELRLYAPLVSKGCYLIVEDTNISGYPYIPHLLQNGPAEALKAFQPVNHGFEVDRGYEKHLHTFHPGGYLRRVR